MNDTDHYPQVTMRIPGAWKHPGELLDSLPTDFQFTDDGLRLPDGQVIEIWPRPADAQFAGVFQSACRRPPTSEEQETIRKYTVNVVLNGPGGSMDAARTMMQAAAAILRAGGAGVFIDNSALAHGGQDWLEMTEDGGSDALSFAFVSIVRSQQEINTMGMHVMGFPDLRMRSSDVDSHGDAMIEIMRYVCGGDRAIDVGHVLADENGPRYQVVGRDQDEYDTESPMHNPYGHLRIVSSKELAEGN